MDTSNDYVLKCYKNPKLQAMRQIEGKSILDVGSWFFCDELGAFCLAYDHFLLSDREINDNINMIKIASCDSSYKWECEHEEGKSFAEIKLVKTNESNFVVRSIRNPIWLPTLGQMMHLLDLTTMGFANGLIDFLNNHSGLMYYSIEGVTLHMLMDKIFNDKWDDVNKQWKYKLINYVGERRQDPDEEFPF